MNCSQDTMITRIITILQDAVRRAMAEDDPDKVLASFIASIGAFLGAESAFLFDDAPLHFYRWTSKGMIYDKQRSIQKKIRLSLRSWIRELVQTGTPVLIPDTASCPILDPALKAGLQAARIHSLVLIGVPLPGSRVGALSLENIQPDAMEQAGELLYLAGTFLLMMLKNRDHIYQLRNNSFIDQMTGVSNRNAFDAYQQHIEGRSSMGILFADINNLKETNDKLGHASGDQRICDTASVLLKYRHDGEVFRIGGDEFVIIWQPIEEDHFLHICQRIRKYMDVQELNVSLGTHWVSEVKDGIAPVMKMADHHMYQEKRRYHKLQVSRS